MEVELRKYRFRVINASNTRTYNLSLDNGGEFIQIGSDGGLLPRSVKLNSFSLAPAERYDIIIDFTAYEGQSIILANSEGRGGDVNPETDANVMQFRVTKPLQQKTKAESRSTSPHTLQCRMKEYKTSEH